MDPHQLIAQRVGVELLPVGALYFHWADQLLVVSFPESFWSQTWLEDFFVWFVHWMKLA
jgi:hypothetical protein